MQALDKIIYRLISKDKICGYKFMISFLIVRFIYFI